TTTENLYYVTGFRSISHALFRGLELYGIFTRRGTGLVVPYIDTTGVAADGIAVDHLACYGKFFFEYADDPGVIGTKIRQWTAALIAEDGIAAVLGMLKPGVTEREAAHVYEQEVLRRGASPFFTVITIGERAALADVYPSERALRPGDLVRFDLGCVYQGYRSDISRTAVLGRPTEKQARYYGAALAGEQAAMAAMR